MLHIIKGEENELIVTATEKVTVSNPTFLFVLRNEVNNAENVFILANASQFIASYDQFTFTEGSTPAKTFHPGQYHYSIYAQESTTNLDPDQANELVESGLCQVHNAEESEPAENIVNPVHGQNIIEA